MGFGGSFVLKDKDREWKKKKKKRFPDTVDQTHILVVVVGKQATH